MPDPRAYLASRRSFLQAGALGLCSARASLAGLLGSAAAAVPLRLGLVTYNWGKDWDLETLIANCSATGYGGVELRSTHRHGVEITLTASERQRVRRLFEASDVELVGLGSACEYHSPDPQQLAANIEETKQFSQLCHDLGGGGVKVRPNALPDGVPVERTLEQIGRSLNEVARHAADLGVQIRLEVHGRGTSSIPHIRTIMDVADHPNTVLCWNCNPQDLEGEGFDANFDLVRSRMGTVHIHDLRRDNYPWEALFERLKGCDNPGFTGWTLMEEGNIPDDILEAMHENRVIWQRLAGG